MGLVAAGQTVHRLSFGHPSAEAAAEALNCGMRPCSRPKPNLQPVVRLLKDYAKGLPVDLGEVEVALGPLTEFQRRVLLACKAIPYGETLTYGQLAAMAGAPGAARAVGNCMARNKIPLIIPCHRVVPSGGKLGRYSAPGGTAVKRRLLLQENPRLG
jgi:methylated-DNA-[protein]-cysteine S-methyltransferase